MDSTNPNERQTSKRGCFFAVDRKAWHYVCGLGNINPAIAYLIMAWGTGRDNRTTSTSTHAVSTHTRIARSRAKAAIAHLMEAGAVTRIEGGANPRYKIAPAHQIPGLVPVRDPVLGPPDHYFSIDETVMGRVRSGKLIAKKDYAAARALVDDGWLVEVDGKFAIGPGPGPEWIWLPNELIMGAVGVTSPIERVRRTGDVMLLRLLVDIYDVQSLADDGGVPRNVLRQNFSRAEMGRYGEFIIYGFRPDGATLWWDNAVTDCHHRKLTVKEKAAGENEGRDFWRRLNRLLDLGLVEWVPHLVDNYSAESEIIHPYGVGNCESVEDSLGCVAHQAAFAALTTAQRDRAVEHGYRLAPVFAADFAEAQMIGVLRTTYRTKSDLTAAWIAKNAELSEVYVAIYKRLIARITQRAADVA